MDKIKLHEEVDKEYKKILDSMSANDFPIYFFSVMEILDVWRMEKEYVDRCGCRIPNMF